MTIRRLETLAAVIGMTLLCAGVGIAFFDRLLGLGLIAASCVLAVTVAAVVNLRTPRRRAEAAAKKALRPIYGRYIAQHERVDAARLLDEAFGPERNGRECR